MGMAAGHPGPLPETAPCPDFPIPSRSRGLTLRNRLVMAPIVTGLAEEAAPGAAQLQWYREHARGGVGLVVVGIHRGWPEDGKLIALQPRPLVPTPRWPAMAGLARAIQAERGAGGCCSWSTAAPAPGGPRRPRSGAGLPR